MLLILDLRMVVSDFLLYYVQKNLWAKTHLVNSVEQKAQSRRCRSNNACKQMLLQ